MPSSIQQESDLKSTRELIGASQLVVTITTDKRPWILDQAIWNIDGAWWLDGTWKTA